MPRPIPVQRVNSGWANGPMTPRRRKTAASPCAAALAEGAAEVEDVLGEREAGGADAGVDDAVDDPVELAPPEQQDEQHRRALERLLDDRRDADGGHGQRVLVRPGCSSRIGGRVEDQRAGAGHERAPAEGEQRAAGVGSASNRSSQRNAGTTSPSGSTARTRPSSEAWTPASSADGSRRGRGRTAAKPTRSTASSAHRRIIGRLVALSGATVGALRPGRPRRPAAARPLPTSCPAG